MSLTNERSGGDLRTALVVAALLAALFLKALPLGLAGVRSENGSDEFDAGRALARLERVLGDERPHPVDTAANDAVRGRLIGEIKALGYAPEVRDDFSCLQRFSQIGCARVRNIIFRAGPAGGDAVMLSSHYDSVPAGPGAGDDGIGVASTLEIAAILAAAPPSRPVIFLITDGEEVGLLGAASFAAKDPLADDVRAVVNLEARGVRGPAQMFETSAPNGRDIKAFAGGAGRPFSNSMMTDIYRLLPNDTDVSVLLPNGYDALNFALTEGVEFYHTPRDNLDALDPKSVQHMGDQALAAVGNFTAQDAAKSDGQKIFADIVSRVFVVLPQWAGGVMLALGLLVAATAFCRAPRLRSIRASLTAPAMLVAAGALAFGAQGLVGALRPEALYWYAYPVAMQALAYFSAAAGALAGLCFVAGGAGRARLVHAAWFWFAAIGAAAYFVAPGASILFALPLVFYAVGVTAGLFRADVERPFAIAAAVIAALLFIPLLNFAEIGLGFAMIAVFAVLASLVFAVAAPLSLDAQCRTGLAPLAACVIGLAFALGAALVVPAYSEAKPRPLSLQYFVDADARTGSWLLAGAAGPAPEPMRAVARFEPVDIAGLATGRLAAEAPFLETTPPELLILGEHISGDVREVRFKLVANGADQVMLRFPAAAGVRRLSQGERVFDLAGDSSPLLYCGGRACDGAEFTALLAPGEPSDWLLFGMRFDLPAAAAPLLDARPISATPIQNGDATIVRIKKTL